MRHVLVASIAFFAACGGAPSTPAPSSTLAAPALLVAAGGTACGPTLVCSAHQQCCITDPLPPAPPRYTCIGKNQACNP